MREVSIRDADRVVLQIGESLGELDGASILDVPDDRLDAILAALTTSPRGNVHLALDWTVTVDPYVAPPPPADQTQYDNAVAFLRSTFGTTRTAAQLNTAVDAITVVLRRLARELQQ